MVKALVQDSYYQILEMWLEDFQEHDRKGMFDMTHCITSGSRENTFTQN